MADMSTMVAFKSLIRLYKLIGKGEDFEGHFVCITFVVILIYQTDVLKYQIEISCTFTFCLCYASKGKPTSYFRIHRQC